ncbi:hypothetical protein ACCQ10_09320 [Xanthomonas sp. NCPPB 1325]|uniref:hypothetical protein n=1 Tax=Xanthomonas sp. NCPPB 1325 TaxID=487529 RepID=UPI003556610E
MNDIEKRAHELWADCHRKQGATQRIIDDCLCGKVMMPQMTHELLRMALSAAPQGVEPAAYQYRVDVVRDGFASSDWEDISRDEYEARRAVMGGHGPKKIAGDTTRGDLRLDPHGWNAELRSLYAAPQVPVDVLRDAERLMFCFEADGFVGVAKDRYEYAMDCAKEAGRDEPSAEDELNGVRRLIDAAMLVAKPEPQA